jgi:hypothetical protein
MTLIFLISILLAFNSYIDINNIIGVININWGKISTKIISLLVGLIILLLLIKVIRRKNEDIVFLDGDIYGYSSWLIYKLASLLGYNKISLKRKPYKIIAKLLVTKTFLLVDEPMEDIVVDFKCEFLEKKNNEECNIIISDTYKIKSTQIPDGYLNNDTYSFERLELEGKRIFSSRYMDEVGKIIMQCRLKKIKINLFMTTNIDNTKYLLNEYIFVGGRDHIEIEIFQMDTKDNEKKFKNIGFKYNGGKN